MWAVEQDKTPFNPFIRLFYQDGKTQAGGLGEEVAGGRRKKSHSCQLAVLSGSGLKLKAKDSSPVEGEKK